ncbi:hypothetical protein J9B06_21565 [Klebsiella pneumoniae]
MIVLQSSYPSTNEKLPVLPINGQEVDILKLNPVAWVSANSGVETNGTAISRVQDKTGKYQWELASKSTSHPPRLITSGKRKALRFGTGVSNPGALKKVGNEFTFPADGIFTLFALIRVPLPKTEGYTGTGGNFCGNNAPEPDLVRFRMGADDYTRNNIFYNHGNRTSAVEENFPINTVAVSDFRDNLWHISVMTAAADHHAWEFDGVLLQQKAIGAKPFATDESRRMIIGSADNPFNHSFMGDIAEIFVIPGVMTAQDKNKVYQYLNGLRADLSAQ